jgi:hypothetical protein
MTVTTQATPWVETKCIARRPQGTPLHRVLREHLPGYLAQKIADGHPAPDFVVREFEAVMRCGDPDYGQAVLVCMPCGQGTVVPYTCKRRGFCPDCNERRMMDRSEFIVDSIIGQTPVRHWIQSLPPPFRFILAYSAEHITVFLTAYTDALSHYQRWRARRMFGLAKVSDAHTGAVTVVQRGSANLGVNVHFHSLVPDGVFVRDDAGQLVFRELPMPSPADVAAIAWRACRRTLKLLAKRGEWRELADPESRRDTVYGELTIGGERRVVRFRADASTHEHDESVPRNDAYPFDLYAGQYVRAGDREELLKLARYVLSPPVTHDQVKVDEQGRVMLRYKRPRQDGTDHAILDPTTFIGRLAALIPRPRLNTVRFHGVWGPRAHNRAEAVPAHEELDDDDECWAGPSEADRQAWASMHHHTHVSDIRRCPRCSGRLVLVALDSPWLIYRNQRKPRSYPGASRKMAGEEFTT